MSDYQKNVLVFCISVQIECIFYSVNVLAIQCKYYVLWTSPTDIRFDFHLERSQCILPLAREECKSDNRICGSQIFAEM